MSAFGDAMRTRREQLGLSLREIARRGHLDAGHLSRIEAGRRPPTPAIASAVDQALGADGEMVALAGRLPAQRLSLTGEGWRRGDAEELGAALLASTTGPVNALQIAHDWLITEPPQLYEVRAGRRIGLSTVETIERRVHQLRLLDDHAGGEETAAVLAAEVTATAETLRAASFTAEVGRRLLVALAELCQLAGWVTSDAGQHAAAARFYLGGVQAAHAAGDIPGAANNLSSLAYQVANIGDPVEAVALARSAYAGARHHASATTRALLLERVAWAHARAGEAGGAERALGAVEDAYADRRPDDDPTWVYWLSPEEISIMAGRVWTELARPLRAVPILERATAGYTADRSRETSLYLSWLGEAFVQAREVERAATTGVRALRLSRVAGSARTVDRIQTLRRALAPHRRVAAVAEFEEEFKIVRHTSGTSEGEKH